MPQLMPIYWLVSGFMLMFILLVLVNLYWYKKEEVKSSVEIFKNPFLFYMW